eukprot:gnl/Chilomastix_cuspidata/8493.p2 GENE.gnl/Chilomastix_cuspidata/8493~~gnl/Chilomastix_cuspidata/8493.p2  ORF type:complete len:115 (+),score=5.81 gnl/Chilomastix_cuspidata/8493:1312-1656(+)
MIFSFRPYFNFFYLNNRLLFLRLLLFLGLLVFKPSVIHNSTNRWISPGRNLNQIKSYFFSSINCIVNAQNTKLITFGVDYSDFFFLNQMIDPCLFSFFNSYFFSPYFKFLNNFK